MEKRWNVYHRGEFFGSKTAREIREALRQGVLDPFDKVSVDGSNIREDLIEVDEIFKETSEQFAKAAANGPIAQPSRLPPQLEEEPALAVPVVFPEPSSPKTSEPQRIGAKTEANTAVYDKGVDDARPDAQGKQAASKRYYLIDRKKSLGPLSALEIHSLFNRGLLSKSVRVQKIGGQRTIPVHQFVANYAGDRLKELAGDGKIPQQIGLGSPSSRVMNELTRMANSKRRATDRKNKTYLLLTGLGFILGALIFLFATNPSQQSSEGKKKSEGTSSKVEEKSIAKGSNKGQKPKLIQKSTDIVDPNPIKETVDSSQTNPEPKVTPNNSQQKSGLSKSKQKRQTTPKVKAPPPPKRPKPAAVREVRPSRPTPVLSKSAVSPKPKAPIEGPIARAKSNAGKTQTVGPLSFNLAALDACPNRCKLSLRDAGGATMTAIFFKAAFYEQLKGLSKSVTVTGITRLEGSELVLIVQDLR
jgi:hypothetical protein